MFKRLFPAFVLAAMLSSVACQQNKKAYPVYFLTQASGTQEGARFIIIYNGTPYTRMPILTLEHVEKFQSFLAEDGSYGVQLKLKKQWSNRLYQASVECSGMKLLPVVNGLAFEPQRFDGPVTDGVLVIWSGLNGYDLKQIGRTVTPVNPEIETKRYRDKNPRPLPQKPKDVKSQVKDPTGRTIGELYN